MDKLDIVTDESGNEVVLLPEIIFSNKQNINWNDVEDYLGKYVGELIEIAETRDIIYIGNKFPDMAVLVIQEKQRAQEQKQRQMRHRESEKWLR